MKTLFILRHAKSSWSDPDLADFDRPLNDRGERAAQFMGELMADKGFAPDVILSSPAVRARQTALLVKDAGGVLSDLVFDDRIYEASPHSLRQVVSEIADSFPSAMLIGHNPGIEGFIRFLTAKNEPMMSEIVAVQFPLLNVFDLPASIYITALLFAIAFIYILVTLCALYPGKQAASIFPAVALHEE